MDAVVSGQARTALLIDDGKFSSFDVDAPEVLRTRHESDVRILFGEATDLRFIQNTRPANVKAELQTDYYKTCALDLALMLLDEDIQETKPLLADSLEELLAEADFIEYLDSIFYPRPLSESADTENALSVCQEAFPKTFDWLSNLVEKQDEISQVREAWDNIAPDVFKDEENRVAFEKTLVREKIFRELVLGRCDKAEINQTYLNAGINRSITSLANHRTVLKEFFAPFKQVLDSEIDKRLLKDEEEETVSTRQRGQRRYDREAVRINVQSQIDYISEHLRKRDLAAAQKLTRELVNYQKGKGEPVHSVKSLCQIAQNAKELGFYKFQLELTEEAKDLQYSDSWTQAQYGDALLRNYRFEDALKTFEIALSFLTGADTERNAVIRTGYAEVLKAQGKLGEAFDIYKETIESHPEDVVARTGYAEVLKAQGKLGEAFDIYKETIESHPENVVARTGYAEVLKAQGKLGEAFDIYKETIASHPENVVARNGYAEVLKAQGKLGEAFDIYKETIASHPEDVVARTGYAEVLKAQGKLSEAFDIYEETMKSHPENVVARNGFCGVLSALERYDEALERLPGDNLETLEDWIGFHIRGMIMLKKGNLTEATEIFEKGSKEDPIPSSREYFQGALALARLRKREFKEASELLEEVTAPLLQPTVNLLRVHAYGELEMFPKAEKAFFDYENSPLSKMASGYWKEREFDLASELNGRYVASRIRHKSDAWLFDREADLLLALAP